MKDKHVSELFKEHCERCIKEDKGKNYNYLQETYAKTELFDLSLLDYPMERADEEYIEKDENKWIMHANFLKEITLPFEAVFIKLPTIEGSPSPAVYLHEFNPSTITGCLMVQITDQDFLTNTFHILADKSELYINMVRDYSFLGEKGELLKRSIASLTLSSLYFVIKNLNNLPKQTIVADKVNRAEYYRRRGLPTLKVFKPIYYVMDKKEGENKNSRSYKLIKPLGKLEYTYSFKVRSHWRRIDPKSYGKNRNGEYVVKGYTFVRDYIKGEGELVKRVRVLK